MQFKQTVLNVGCNLFSCITYIDGKWTSFGNITQQYTILIVGALVVNTITYTMTARVRQS